jgi:hypothetical protein
MRADGKASSKYSATSCSSNTTAMSVATHNKAQFFPGDIICLCDDGGDYKTSIIAPSSGTKSHPVVYKNADGKKPVVDLSVDVGGQSGWTDMGGGVYRKKGFGRAFWEDDVPLKAASSESCSDGNWYYPISSYLIYYKPTNRTPANHRLRTMWFDDTSAGLDIRNRSHIAVHGLNFYRCGFGIWHGHYATSSGSSITDIVLNNNKFTRCFWAIWSQIKNNAIESDVYINDNFIDYCNGGISAWTFSDTTQGHSQHHTRYLITGNQILHLYSITDNKVWSDTILKSYVYTDHEGISFQDVQDSTISNNTISATFDKNFTSDEYWTRAIFFYLTNGRVPTSGNKVLRNFIYGHYNPAIYITTAVGHAGFENNVIAYNLIQYDGSYPSHGSFATRSTSDNVLKGINYFVNNTIYHPKSGLAISAVYHKDGNWVVRNNVVNSHGNIYISSGNDTGGFTIDHNIYSHGDAFQIGDSGMQFDHWRKKYDSVGSKIADNLFVSPGKDFRLRSKSPAIRAGVSVGFKEDFSGNHVPGRPSIGAYEYQKIN